MAVRPAVTRTIDNRAKVAATIRRLASAEVLVGIPQQNTPRTESGAATNALLGYVHEHGDPDRNLPARPWLKPGVAERLPQIQGYLRNAGQRGVQGDEQGMLQALRAAGQTGASAAQDKITTGPFAPLSERTIIARLRKTQAGLTRLRRMRRAGQDIVAWGQSNLKPLIDTGQLRRAVSFVVRLGGRDV